MIAEILLYTIEQYRQAGAGRLTVIIDRARLMAELNYNTKPARDKCSRIFGYPFKWDNSISGLTIMIIDLNQ